MDYKKLNNVVIDDLQNQVLQFSLKLYNDPYISRKAIDDIMNFFNSFLNLFFIPFIEQEMDKHIKSSINAKAYNKIKYVLDNCKNMFDTFSTEHRRLALYTKKDLYVPPILVEIGKQCVYVQKSDERKIDMKSVYAAHVPLRHSFKSMFEKPGVFDRVNQFMDQLSREKMMMSNIIQGELWLKKYHDSNKLVYPIYLYADEFECRNALGSRAGHQKLCGVYAAIACFPPEWCAKLKNIFLASIFYAKHLKEFGNKATFQHLIEELNFLSRDGINIVVNGNDFNIYFECVLILGDNLGLNTLCGFSRSFTARIFCRICTAPKDKCKIMTMEKEEYLRTPDMYFEAIKNNDLESIGMKEVCIFDHIDKFCIAENMTVDLMHDLCEGVAAYTISRVLEGLIQNKIISLKTINYRIETFNYDKTENKNKPQQLFFLKSKQGAEKIKIKQSSAELLCLSRYLGLMIGDLVPVENEYWKLYLSLRQIIGVITSPILSRGQIQNFNELVRQHNELYFKFEKKLKPKMHFLLHYSRIMFMNGPVFHFSADKFERKNKKLKDIVVGTSTNVHLPTTIAIRHQLELCSSYSFVTDNGDVELGKVDQENAYKMIKSLLPSISTKFSVASLKNVFILGKSFEVGSVFVFEITEEGPRFGIIYNIFHCENDVYFQAQELHVSYFDQHVYSYRVFSNYNEPYLLININRVIRTAYCLTITNNNVRFIATRYDL